jgi:hypothetical protein
MIDDLDDIVRLIEAWSRWCRAGCGYGKVSISGIYRLYKAPSVYREDRNFFQKFPIDKIMACDAAWRSLPKRYRLLIMFYYVKRYSAQKACLRSGIKFADFAKIHCDAVKMIKNIVY